MPQTPDIIRAVLDGASVDYCPAHFLYDSEEDAIQVEGVPGAEYAGINGRAFIYLSDRASLAQLGAALVTLGAEEVVERVGTRALLDIASASASGEVWRLYRAAMRIAFPNAKTL